MSRTGSVGAAYGDLVVLSYGREMKKRTGLFAIRFIIIVIIIGVIVVTIGYCKILDSQDSVKKAIRIEDISPDQDYILAKMIRTTGYDWELVEEDYKQSQYRLFCNIRGPNPDDLHLEYIFWSCDNTYVFYVLECREYFNEEANELSLEYIVSGWDILYPVNRGGFGLLRTNKHITSKDIAEPGQR